MDSPQKELRRIGTLPITEEIEALAVDVSQVYGCAIDGDCMKPQFHHGDNVVVCPLSRPERGDTVLLWPEGAERPLLKRLVLWIDVSEDIEPVLIVEQINPPRRLRFDPSKVRAVHKAIGRVEAEAPCPRAVT